MELIDILQATNSSDPIPCLLTRLGSVLYEAVVQHTTRVMPAKLLSGLMVFIMRRIHFVLLTPGKLTHISVVKIRIYKSDIYTVYIFRLMHI